MRRDFKFRGWNANMKKMEDNLSARSWLFDFLDQSPELVVMQYTGLKDKNDKEIYEGDILTGAYNDNLYIVEFKHGEFICERGIHILGRSLWYKTEIVGNIYENPELIEHQPS